MSTSGNPKEQIRQFLTEKVARGKGITDPISDSDNLIESGIIDSLGITRLVTYLEKTLLVKVPDEDIVPENFESIEALVRYLKAAGLLSTASEAGS